MKKFDMTFNNLCKVVLTEAYTPGEVFITLNDNEMDHIGAIPQISVEALSNDPLVKISELTKAVIASLVESLKESGLTYATEMDRGSVDTQFSKEDVVAQIASDLKTLIPNVRTGKADRAAVKIFSMLIRNDVLKAVRFKNIPKKTETDEEDNFDQEKIDKESEEIADAEWLGSKRSGEDITPYIRRGMNDISQQNWGRPDIDFG